MLPRLEGVRVNGDGSVMALCPVHADHNPSLRVWTDDDGRLAWNCYAGCDHAAVGVALGIESGHAPGDDYPTTYKPKDAPEALPIIAKYRYVDESGAWLYTVGRTGRKDFPVWRPDADAETGIAWGLGDSRRVLYNLAEVMRAVGAGEPVWITEGEKDADALRRAGVAATCNPHGAGKWRDDYTESLRGALVTIVADKDEPGRKHARQVADSLQGVARQVFIVEAKEGKDAADHLAAGYGVDQFVIVDDVRPPISLPPNDTATVPPVEAPELASCPDILAAFAAVVTGRGVVGEDRFAKVVYLALTSRVLPRPVSVAAKGPSSAGKSFVVERTVDFFPTAAYYALSSMSEHALAYSDEPLAHRFLILYEAAGLESDFASYLLRSLLSEGRIRYETVEKIKGQGMVPRLIEREGPTGLIVTTTQVSLHPENETRLLSVPANDTAEQTKAVIRMIACEDSCTGDDELFEWRQLQAWIAGQHNAVTVPYAVDLAELVPPVAVRLRRDFTTVLSLIKAHAILHQRTRACDDAGRILATVDDYAVVRGLVADLVADEVGATVPRTTAETVGAVSELLAEHEHGVTYIQLGERLSLDKSAARRRAAVAITGGYLKNLETRRGQPAKLVIGEPLPGEIAILPLPADVAAAHAARTGGTVAGANEGREQAEACRAGDDKTEQSAGETEHAEPDVPDVPLVPPPEKPAAAEHGPDDLLDRGLVAVVTTGAASLALIGKRCACSPEMAAAVLATLEDCEIVAPGNGAARSVLVDDIGEARSRLRKRAGLAADPGEAGP